MVDLETNPLYYAAAGGILLAISTSMHYILKGNVTGMSAIMYDVAFVNVSNFCSKLRSVPEQADYCRRHDYCCWDFLRYLWLWDL